MSTYSLAGCKLNCVGITCRASQKRCQLCHRYLKQNKTKIIPQRRIIEAGHREKDRADLKGGYEKRLSKNRGPYCQRGRSWIRFRSVPFLLLAKTFYKLHPITQWELVNYIAQVGSVGKISSAFVLDYRRLTALQLTKLPFFLEKM